MNETKRWYKSKGVVGGYVATAASLLAIVFSIDIGAEEQVQIVELITMLVGAAAGLLSAYGRIKGRSQIT